MSASYGKNILAITESNGDVIWSYNTAGREKGHAGHHDVHMLKNGNILFHETWQDVKEINLNKEIVWKYDCATENGNQGRGVNVHAFSRLANGITQIVESGVGRVIDVDDSGKLIRSFALKPGGTSVLGGQEQLHRNPAGLLRKTRRGHRIRQRGESGLGLFN